MGLKKVRDPIRAMLPDGEGYMLEKDGKVYLADAKGQSILTGEHAKLARNRMRVVDEVDVILDGAKIITPDGAEIIIGDQDEAPPPTRPRTEDDMPQAPAPVAAPTGTMPDTQPLPGEAKDEDSYEELLRAGKPGANAAIMAIPADFKQPVREYAAAELAPQGVTIGDAFASGLLDALLEAAAGATTRDESWDRLLAAVDRIRKPADTRSTALTGEADAPAP